MTVYVAAREREKQMNLLPQNIAYITPLKANFFKKFVISYDLKDFFVK